VVVNEENIDKIIRFLNLEKITVKQKFELLLFPTKIDNEFDEKIKFLEKELGCDVTIKIVDEGVYKNVKNNISIQSSRNGFA